MNLLLLSQISEAAFVALSERHSVQATFVNSTRLSEQAAWHESEAEVVILRSGVSLDYERLVRMRHLRAVIRAGSGTDNIDVDFLRSHNIPLFTIKDLNAEAVAELTFGLFLNLARHITSSDNMFRQGYWSKSRCLGTELHGKTLGIIGLGRIGTRVAVLGLAWKMNVIGVVRTFNKERAKVFSNQGIDLLASTMSIASQSDFISVHVPLTPHTERLVNVDFVNQMKSTAFLVNVARAGIVDEEALYKALKNKCIAGAGIDVHENELCKSRFAEFTNVVLTPHLGSSTREAQEAIGREIVSLIEKIEKEAAVNA